MLVKFKQVKLLGENHNDKIKHQPWNPGGYILHRSAELPQDSAIICMLREYAYNCAMLIPLKVLV
jgi:hypothetical protein